MKFIVTRVSRGDDTPPCKEAKEAVYTRIDERLCNDPAKIPAYKGQSPDWWLKEGRNHRVEHGHIMRDFDTTGWFIELDTMEDLLRFRNKYGAIIIQQWSDNPSILELRIYDGYNE